METQKFSSKPSSWQGGCWNGVLIDFIHFLTLTKLILMIGNDQKHTMHYDAVKSFVVLLGLPLYLNTIMPTSVIPYSCYKVGTNLIQNLAKFIYFHIKHVGRHRAYCRYLATFVFNILITI